MWGTKPSQVVNLLLLALGVAGRIAPHPQRGAYGLSLCGPNWFDSRADVFTLLRSGFDLERRRACHIFRSRESHTRGVIQAQGRELILARRRLMFVVGTLNPEKTRRNS